MSDIELNFNRKANATLGVYICITDKKNTIIPKLRIDNLDCFVASIINSLTE